MFCWNCKIGEMLPDAKLGKSWLRCVKCGATWSNDPLFQKQRRKAKK